MPRRLICAEELAAKCSARRGHEAGQNHLLEGVAGDPDIGGGLGLPETGGGEIGGKIAFHHRAHRGQRPLKQPFEQSRSPVPLLASALYERGRKLAGKGKRRQG